MNAYFFLVFLYFSFIYNDCEEKEWTLNLYRRWCNNKMSMIEIKIDEKDEDSYDNEFLAYARKFVKSLNPYYHVYSMAARSACNYAIFIYKYDVPYVNVATEDIHTKVSELGGCTLRYNSKKFFMKIGGHDCLESITFDPDYVKSKLKQAVFNIEMKGK